MKLTFGIFLILAVGSVAPQDHVTEGLLASQADLALGHLFFETAIFLNRGQISSYLYRINREIINSHIGTYAFIKNLGFATRDELDEIATTPENEQCVADIRNRWDLQITRYGHRLATCVNAAYRLILEWSVFVNDLHTTAQIAGNQVQNIAVSTLSHTEIFDDPDTDFPANVNRSFRILLKTYLSYRERFDGFLEQVSGDYLDTIRELVSCDVDLEEEFEREVTRDMQRARSCVGEGPGGEQTPAPTL